MPRYALIVDVKKCVGCFACRVACQNQNSLPAETSLIRFEDHETGKYPNVKYEVVTLQCMHCEDAPCVPVCPTNASVKDKQTGLTLVNQDKCIGCRRCVVACPYHARHYVKETGVVQGCNLCLSLLQAGQEPACVSTCLTKARLFGDLDDPKGDFAKLLPKAKPLRPDFKTKPTTLYIFQA